MREIKVSAPGKVHLVGEHAVVYGEGAIIAAIGKRTYVKIKPSRVIKFRDLNWPAVSRCWMLNEISKITDQAVKLWKRGNEKKDFSELFFFIKKNSYQNYQAVLLGLAMKSLKIKEGFSILVKSQIPPGVGLGSSASRAVAITMALAKFFQKQVSLKKINEIAFEQEKIIHGTPSGGDNFTCCFGGLIWFKKTPEKEEIKSLKKEVNYQLKNFVFVNTGLPKKTTGELVQLVRNLKEEYREERIKKIGQMSKEMVLALKERDFQKVKLIINETQKNLKELGVSTRKIDELVEKVQKIGGAAKLCGAGGGGIVMCYFEEKKRLIQLLKKLGYKPWECELGVQGVKIEKENL